MKAKKPLVAKTALKSKTVLKPRKITKKQAQAEISLLKRKADALFGHYVRLRDAEPVSHLEWVSECISCGRRNVVRWYNEDDHKWHWGRRENIGHFVGRLYWFLRYDDRNCNGQCVYCNQHLKGNTAAYHKALDAKYGDGTANELIELAYENKTYQITKADLEEAIKTSTEYLNWCYEREQHG